MNALKVIYRNRQMETSSISQIFIWIRITMKEFEKIIYKLHWIEINLKSHNCRKRLFSILAFFFSENTTAEDLKNCWGCAHQEEFSCYTKWIGYLRGSKLLSTARWTYAYLQESLNQIGFWIRSSIVFIPI